MSAIDTPAVFEKYIEVEEALKQLNKELNEQNISIESFCISYDIEFEGHVAQVIYVVDGDTVDDSLEVLDAYCEMAGEALRDFVVFVYCIYRTSTDYIEDFVNETWENVLRKVSD